MANSHTADLEIRQAANTRKLNHWAIRETRRQFLIGFAEKMGFNPMQKANWKGMSTRLIANKVYIILIKTIASLI